jgi:hypothetical protein
MIRNPLSGRMVGANGVVGEMLLAMHKKKEIKLPQKDVAILKGGGGNTGSSNSNSTSNSNSNSTSNSNSNKTAQNIPLSMIYDGIFVPIPENTSLGKIHARVKHILSNKEVKEKFFKEIDRLTYDGRIDVLVGIIGDVKVHEYEATHEEYKEIIDYIIASLVNEAKRVYKNQLEDNDGFWDNFSDVNYNKKGNVILDGDSREIYHQLKNFKMVFVCNQIHLHLLDNRGSMYTNRLRTRILMLIAKCDYESNEYDLLTTGLCLPCEFDKDTIIKDVISMIRGLPIFLMVNFWGEPYNVGSKMIDEIL